ncbi:Aste57867_9464 [Aphanomyces stellatus]|uniref:Aste57867_9464 protein n=1 Tax=Aphanomyces stellatus TaxID=120398 RepID=A0A485KMY4_9STRA|nr:hypothetical protein As57867_009427 [Aphanomyces stellatus]VFT86343.1 Aste57867_9464 [Aphanomyces stellatus]
MMIARFFSMSDAESEVVEDIVSTADDIGLMAEEVDHFVTHGYVMLRNAFPEDVAAACREFLWNRMDKDGVKEHDCASWPEKHWISESYDDATGAPWTEVLTPRLKRAMDQLCGKDRWNQEDLVCGWWVITFPGHAMPPWAPAGHWHVDGARYVHHLDSKESGLLPIFLFSDIDPSDGGTALAPGSHVNVAHILEEAIPHGMKGGQVSAAAKSWVYQNKKQWVEVQGRAGDVMLTHPFLVHARSKNCGSRVRFMCNPNVGLKEPMRFDREDDAEHSAVEAAVVEALRLPSTLQHRNKKRKR